jgi:hypothetical protein
MVESGPQVAWTQIVLSEWRFKPERAQDFGKPSFSLTYSPISIAVG